MMFPQRSALYVVERLLCFLIVGIHASGISIYAVSIDVISMKSSLDSLFDPACVSARVMIDKLDLIP